MGPWSPAWKLHFFSSLGQPDTQRLVWDQSVLFRLEIDLSRQQSSGPRSAHAHVHCVPSFPAPDPPKEAKARKSAAG